MEGQHTEIPPPADDPRPLVYAIGTLGFGFPTEARRDAFRRRMEPVPEPGTADGGQTGPPPDPDHPGQLRRYLMGNPWASDKLTWTLDGDHTPVYALEAETPVGLDRSGPPGPGPSGPAERDAPRRAAEDPGELARLLETLRYPPVSRVYRIFRDAIAGQGLPADDPGFVSRVTVPGRLTGRSTRLRSGQVVPVVEVSAHGLHAWYERALIDRATAAISGQAAGHDPAWSGAGSPGRLEEQLRALLDKVYQQFRNLGRSAADRAANHVGTDAFLLGTLLGDGLLSARHVPGARDHLYALEGISVAGSPACRPGSDCHDVVVTFRDPADGGRPRVAYRFTIDVSDELPVSLAPVHVSRR
ncbi:hypothetical protein [Streptomyces sp. NPDC018031]|uniref:cyanobactin maturation protease PatG family protein n=1 Tax=Streptomyces sp. NPDC018031 TaxID=3365033 RepID=UPI0037B5E86C